MLESQHRNSQMLEDEKYQREAFQALLLRQDDRAAEIQDQMAMVQHQLAALTMVEMKKRDMKVSCTRSLASGNLPSKSLQQPLNANI